RVLDLGCGDGIATLVLQDRYAHVVGVDLSPTMLAEARQRGVVDTRVANGNDLKGAGIEANEFDAVFSNYGKLKALHWMADGPEKVVQGMHRCLKPGGILVAKLGGHQTMSSICAPLMAILDTYGLTKLPVPLYFPTEDEYRGLLEQYGFQVDSIETEPTVLNLPITLRQYIELFAGPLLGDWADDEKRRDVFDRLERSMQSATCRNGKFHMNYAHLNVVARKL
ncbi:S-adenosyl-L-methionine-dependent methyltransferase, partial [Dimargaris cristalligena]